MLGFSTTSLQPTWVVATHELYSAWQKGSPCSSGGRHKKLFGPAAFNNKAKKKKKEKKVAIFGY
jgi:hypothetical protein